MPCVRCGSRSRDLLDVRYLAGNPCKAVIDPKIVQLETAIRIQRALPAVLWRRLRNDLDRRCQEKGGRKLGALSVR
jgi:hypothetical protein